LHPYLAEVFPEIIGMEKRGVGFEDIVQPFLLLIVEDVLILDLMTWRLPLFITTKNISENS